MEKYPEFNYKDKFIPDKNYAIFLNGSCGSGKTTCLQDIWVNYLRPTYDLIIMFCDNPQADIYDFILPHEREFVYPQFIVDIVKEFDFFQHETKNALRVMFVFDDCSSRKGNKFNDMIQQLFIRRRNINAGILFSTQVSTFITKESRANLDFVFQLHVNSNEMRESVAKVFFRNEIYPTTKEGVKVNLKGQAQIDYIESWMDRQLAQEDRNIIIITNDTRGKNIYHYKVDFKSLQKKIQKSFEKKKRKRDKKETSFKKSKK